MSTPMPVLLDKALLFLSGSRLKAATSLLLLICLSQPHLPVAAKDPARAEATKPDQTQSKTDSKANTTTPAAAEKASVSKKTASFADPVLGAKTTDELAKKLSEAYTKRDDVIYLSVVKAPMRTRIRMRQQFKHDCKRVMNNFKYLTLAQEAARLKVPAGDLTKSKITNGVEEAYDLPVVGFIYCEIPNYVKAPVEILTVAVCKSKDAYYLEARHPVAVGAKDNAAATTSATSTQSPSAPAAVAPTKAPAPAKAH